MDFQGLNLMFQPSRHKCHMSWIVPLSTVQLTMLTPLGFLPIFSLLCLLRNRQNTVQRPSLTRWGFMITILIWLIFLDHSYSKTAKAHRHIGGQIRNSRSHQERIWPCETACNSDEFKVPWGCCHANQQGQNKWWTLKVEQTSFIWC